MSAIILSAAQVDDLEVLNQLMFELHDEHHRACPAYFKTAHDIEQEKSIARYLDDPECLVYVAKQGSQIVGFITGHFCELISSVSQPIPMGSIDELYVVPCYRQQRVAASLLAHLEQTFVEYGVKEMFVEVWEFNQTAQHFYQQGGFVPHIHWLRKPLSQQKV
ncbi:GNAT family N-acetyltransferase [Vibrio metschnikovii]|uniref:GNAT family N-acetyltransferase n=3 Tax=Bacteria TaxID=2 RepID=UPI001482E0BE|nr:MULTISPECIES: GNAT family N-acetyltransferase [Vibrio]EKO3626691.1 GNAT family N-acetyltransferase [Vibrio metschnikovii]EKO3657646.1 GNAT family N-acetyltransferase [Vibrio metschnikovii]EKO3924586.1 GNAT family N-acetyltransferase [Vibrio metschnikovii]MDM7485160.1 GNAT family N-acetyltransferase [Vibrio metschnikovii]NNN84431.1 GNAT family N-acetyltransferase [Vibrio sp. A8-1]